MQRLIAEGPLVKLRALQLWAAHMSLLSNSSGLQDLSWKELQQTFRHVVIAFSHSADAHTSYKMETAKKT